jgi:hypothetical protein
VPFKWVTSSLTKVLFFNYVPLCLFTKKEYEGVKILSPAEFLEAVKEKI